MTYLHVVPAPGRTVPDLEVGGVLPAAGRVVEKSQYWMRRLQDGDVVLKSAQEKGAVKRTEA